MPAVQLCDFCLRNVCESNKLWALHHVDWSALETSAESLCVFCSSILRSVRSRYSNPQDLILPVYRWNIRRITRTRDTHDIVAVVFRPIDNLQKPSVGDKGGSLPQKTFHFHLEKDVGNPPKYEELDTSTNSEQSWAQIHKWFNECRNNHSRCQPKFEGNPPLPTRLLDIGNIDPDPTRWSMGKLQLVDTEQHTIKGSYATISHKWGTHRFETTTAANAKQAITEGFSMDDKRLTRNFREAISVVRNLGIRYIWIDSICILQQDQEDFDKEAPRMHDYYRYAICNIAAADANEPYDGLFRSRSSDQDRSAEGFARYQSKADNKNFGEASWIIVPTSFWEEQLLQNPLYSRAWVFQERLLAQRILHFSKHQIFFECATISACETLPAGIPHVSGIRAATDRHWRERLQFDMLAGGQPLAGSKDLSIEEFWGTVVDIYSRCNLTRDTDKVIALHGVATLVGKALDQDYRDGLWSNQLEEQLAWHVVDCRQENGDDSIRPEDCHFPSWSWASVKGVVAVHDRFATERIYTVRSHDGQEIKFELDRKKQVIDTPDAFKTGQKSNPAKDEVKEGHSGTNIDTKQTHNEIDHSKPWSRLAKLPDQDSMIRIQGNLRRGKILWNFDSRKGTMMPHGSPDVRCEVFLDELPPRKSSDQDNDREYDCLFFVLAYGSSGGQHSQAPPPSQEHLESRYDNDSEVNLIVRRESRSSKAATYSGIGLIVGEEVANHFSRRGTFYLHSLNEEQLSALVTTDMLHGQTLEIKTDQPLQDFYLC